MGNQVVSAYIIALLGILLIFLQIKHTLRINRKASLFDKLSAQIQEAINLSRMISDSTNLVISSTADAANSMKMNIDLDDKKAVEEENKRRAELINMLYDGSIKRIENIRDSHYKILDIITAIEKDTIISGKSKRAARYLFYFVQDQYDLLGACTNVLTSIRAVQPIGLTPNIPPDTFNQLAALISKINEKNTFVFNYLDDLEIILHNDLVKSFYGRAHFSKLRQNHLTVKGLTDWRTKNPLL